MNELAVARALHVLAIVLWIGGVAFVTTVLLPAVRNFKTPVERVAFFDAIERKFAWQARATTLIAGVTGFYMTEQLDLWSRFSMPAYWWMHAMAAVWSLFTLMLFIAEPLILHRLFHEGAAADPEATFVLIERMHRVLLIAGPDHNFRRGCGKSRSHSLPVSGTNSRGLPNEPDQPYLVVICSNALFIVRS